MELTLKKALNLRSKLEEFVSDTTLPLTASLSIFVADNRDQPDLALDKARADLEKRIAEKLNASRILAALRPAIVRVNADNQIEELLAQQAHEERSVALWKAIAAAAEQPVPDAVKGELEVLHRRAAEDKPQNNFGSHTLTRAATFSVVTEELRDRAKANAIAARRSREDIADKRTALNITARIRIADEDVAFLTEQGFL